MKEGKEKWRNENMKGRVSERINREDRETIDAN
jgi:hypothetical protein